MVRIITNETPTEELKRRFADEVRGMMKKAALNLGCDVEELKYRVNNAGVVEIQRMELSELIDLAAKEAIQSRELKIRKRRGGLDG